MKPRFSAPRKRIVNIEYNLFTEVRETIKAKLTEIQGTAKKLPLWMCLRDWPRRPAAITMCGPQLTNNGQIDIKDGRHL